MRPRCLVPGLGLILGCNDLVGIHDHELRPRADVDVTDSQAAADGYNTAIDDRGLEVAISDTVPEVGPIDTGGTTDAVGGATNDAATWDCGASNVFCDDFDGPTLGLAKAGKQWDVNSFNNLTQSSAGSAAIDTADGSRGGVMHVAISGELPGGGVVAMLRHNLEYGLGLSTEGTVTIEFDFRAIGGSVYPFGLFCGADHYQLSFNMDTNCVSEQNGQVPGQYHEFPRTSLPDPGSAATSYFADWRHIEVVLNRRDRLLSMKVDQVTTLEPTYLAHVDLSTGGCDFGLGVFSADSHDGTLFWDGYYDNVRIKVTP